MNPPKFMKLVLMEDDGTDNGPILASLAITDKDWWEAVRLEFDVIDQLFWILDNKKENS